MAAALAVPISAGLLVVVYFSVATSVFAQILSTLVAALIAGVAAISASQLTGIQVQAVEAKKHAREVVALKTGLLEELVWAIEVLREQIVWRHGNEKIPFVMAEVDANVLPKGLKVYDRAAGVIAMAGSEYVFWVIQAYGALGRPVQYGVTNGVNLFSRYDAALMGRVLLCTWHAAQELEPNNETRRRAEACVKNLACEMYENFFEHPLKVYKLTRAEGDWINEFLDFVSEELFDEKSGPSKRLVCDVDASSSRQLIDWNVQNA